MSRKQRNWYQTEVGEETKLRDKIACVTLVLHTCAFLFSLVTPGIEMCSLHFICIQTGAARVPWGPMLPILLEKMVLKCTAKQGKFQTPFGLFKMLCIL